MCWNWPVETTCGPLNKTISVNQACLDVISDFDVYMTFYVKSAECFECDYELQKRMVKPHNKTSYVIDTSFDVESFFSNGKKHFCQMRNHFEDFGHYQINISGQNCSSIDVLKEPEKFWLNFSVLICIYLFIPILYWMTRLMYKRLEKYVKKPDNSVSELTLTFESPEREGRISRVREQSRMASLDTFRGITITIMIFVNYGGGEYSTFKHTPWNGLSFADLVFPWFVWIMGASIVLSLRSSLRAGNTRKKIFNRIVRRSILLMAFGLILNSGKWEKHGIRICGVLQRLGITYFVVATIELLVAKPQRNERFGPYYCQDIVDSWMELLIAIFFAVAHVVVTFTLKVPGCPTGYLGPGGFAEHSSHRNCTGGAAGYIDRLVLTPNHMYRSGSFVKIYQPPVPYDPEGLLGTLTSILCAFFGVCAAKIILSFENSYTRIKKWILWAVLTGISAGFLCNWSQNDGLIPVNKNLWSLSYVLTTSSMAFLVLAVFYLLIDINHVWKGSPFIYSGMNSITLYLGHSLLKDRLPWKWIPFTNTHLELLFMDVTATVIWIFISYILYKHKIFITL